MSFLLSPFRRDTLSEQSAARIKELELINSELEHKLTSSAQLNQTLQLQITAQANDTDIATLLRNELLAKDDTIAALSVENSSLVKDIVACSRDLQDSSDFPSLDQSLNNHSLANVKNILQLISHQLQSVNDLEAKVQMYESKIQYQKAQLDIHNDEMDQVNDELDQLKSSIALKDETITSLRQQLETSANDSCTMSTAIEKYKSEISEFETQESLLNCQVSELKDNLRNLNEKKLSNDLLQSEVTFYEPLLNQLASLFFMEKKELLHVTKDTVSSQLMEFTQYFETLQDELISKSKNLQMLEDKNAQYLFEIENANYCLETIKQFTLMVFPHASNDISDYKSLLDIFKNASDSILQRKNELELEISLVSSELKNAICKIKRKNGQLQMMELYSLEIQDTLLQKCSEVEFLKHSNNNISNTQHHALMNQKVDLENSLREFQLSIVSKDEDIKKYQQQIEEHSNIFSSKNEQYSQEIQNLQNQNNQLKSKIYSIIHWVRSDLNQSKVCLGEFFTCFMDDLKMLEQFSRSEFEKQHNFYNTQIADLNNKNETEQKSKSDLEISILKLQTIISQSDVEKIETNHALEIAKKELSLIKEQHTKLLEKYEFEADEASIELNRISEMCNSLAQDLEIIQFEKHENEIEISHLKEQNVSSEQRIIYLEKSQTEFKNKYDSLTNELSSLMRMFSNDAILDPLFGTLDDAMSPVYDFIESLSTRMDNFKDTLGSLEVYKQDLDNTILELRATISLRDSELDEAFEKLEKVESDLNNQSIAVSEKDRMNEHLSWLLAQSKEQMLAYETNNEKMELTAQIEDLKLQLNLKLNDLQLAESRLEQCDALIEKLEVNFDTLKSENVTQKRIAELSEIKLQESTEEFTLQIKDLEELKDESLSKISDLENVISTLKEEYTTLFNNMQNASNSIILLQEQVDQSNVELGQFKNLDKTNQEKINNYVSEIEQLNNQIHDFREDISNCSMKINKLLNERNELQLQISEKASENMELNELVSLSKQSNDAKETEINLLKNNMQQELLKSDELSQMLENASTQLKVVEKRESENIMIICNKFKEAGSAELPDDISQVDYIINNIELRNSQISEVRQSNDNLENQILSLKTEIGSINDRALEYLASSDNFENQFKTIKDRLSSLFNNLNNLAFKLTENEQFNGDMLAEDVLDTISFSVTKLQNDHALLNQTLEDFKLKNSLETENYEIQLSTLNAKYETDIKDMADKMDSTLLQIENLNADLLQSKQRESELSMNISNISELPATDSNETALLNEKISSLMTLVEEKTSTISAFEQALLQAQEYMEEKDISLENKNTALAELETNLEKANSDILEITLKFEELKNLKEQNSVELDKKVSDLENTNLHLESQVSNYLNQVAALNDSISKISNINDSRVTEIEEKHKLEICLLETKIIQLNNEIENLKNKNLQLTESTENMTVLIEISKAEELKLAAELETARLSVKENIKCISEFELQIKSMESIVENMKDKISALENEVSERECKISELQSEILSKSDSSVDESALLKTISESNETINTLKANAEQKLMEFAQLEQNAKDTEAHNETLNEKYKMLMTKYEKVESALAKQIRLSREAKKSNIVNSPGVSQTKIKPTDVKLNEKLDIDENAENNLASNGIKRQRQNNDLEVTTEKNNVPIQKEPLKRPVEASRKVRRVLNDGGKDKQECKQQ